MKYTEGFSFIRFGCGLAFGSVIGLGVWVGAFEIGSASGLLGFIVVGGTALFCGLFSGISRLRFWQRVSDWVNWW